MKMAISIDLQNESSLPSIPETDHFSKWVMASLQCSHDVLEQTIRIVDESEGRQLNRDYRGKDTATNVLAFPTESQWLDYECLGDLVICAPVVAREAQEQGKTLEAHWAHLVVHGMLHLQGFDHQNSQECDEMEAEEIKILDSLGYTNPYND
ncbi:MAG: rRNA maturation RNase YbeY [Pseudomonadota bacterium]